MNIEEFLAPISPEKPCGENLEYDADFQIMNQASQGKAEQQFGDTIIPAEPADWNTVEKYATSLLTRTKDLRVLLALTHAWTRRRGLAGYADGLLLVQEAIARYWETLYPLLEEYGETDPFYRINALAGLSDKSDLTVAVRNASLLRSNGDEISLRDAQALLDGSKTECPDYPGGRPRLIDELARGDQSDGFQQLFHLGHAAFTEMPGEKLANRQQTFVNDDNRGGAGLVAAGQLVNQPWTAAGIVRTFRLAAV
ncbi:type VI secretion system protein TssA, partial [Enterobacter asburiae]|uniref:type VI secretion system protein TssA n=1 Tax=Enterobacter asburiae TaxID=61645 RepID=UPI001E2C8655